MTNNIKTIAKAQLLYKCHDQTGEGSAWIPELNSYFWLDIDNGILHQYDDATGKVQDHYFPEMITSIIPWKGHPDEIILAMKCRCIAYNVKKQTWKTLCELDSLVPMLRTNDCKASPEGRLWCGIIHMKNHNGTGALYRIGENLQPVKVLAEQNIPNGIVWNKEGTKMYYADTGRSCIEEYAYDKATGKINYIREAIKVPLEYGGPDGMTIDSKGNLWVSHWGGFGVYVWNPNSGELLGKISVDAPNVASCTFGGKEGNRLFITTARDDMTEEEKKKYPLSGSLFTVILPEIKPGENHYPFFDV